MSSRLLLVVSLLWQVLVYLLAQMGIFSSIYDLYGIPWDAEGALNVFGTCLGLALLESPLLILAGTWPPRPFTQGRLD